MTLYNMTTLQDAETLTDLLVFADSTLGYNTLSGMFLIALFFIIIFSMRRASTIEGVMAASFVCFFIGVILAFGGLVDIYIPIVFATILIFSVLWYSLKGS